MKPVLALYHWDAERRVQAAGGLPTIAAAADVPPPASGVPASAAAAKGHHGIQHGSHSGSQDQLKPSFQANAAAAAATVKTPVSDHSALPFLIIVVALASVPVVMCCLYVASLGVEFAPRVDTSKPRLRERIRLGAKAPPYGPPDSLTRASSESTTAQAHPATPPEDQLCPSLVATGPDGLGLIVGGHLGPNPQEQVLDVSDADTGESPIIRALVSECGPDAGILLETKLQCAIAFLDTASAIYDMGKEPQRGRFVHVRKAGQSGWDKASSGYFAIVEAETDCPTRFLMKRKRQNGTLETIFAVTMDGRGLIVSISDAGGRPVALPETRPGASVSAARRYLRVLPDIDASLVLCAAMAAQKLQ